jgi:hypothetical protein
MTVVAPPVLHEWGRLMMNYLASILQEKVDHVQYIDGLVWHAAGISCISLHHCPDGLVLVFLSDELRRMKHEVLNSTQ